MITGQNQRICCGVDCFSTLSVMVWCLQSNQINTWCCLLVLQKNIGVSSWVAISISLISQLTVNATIKMQSNSELSNTSIVLSMLLAITPGIGFTGTHSPQWLTWRLVIPSSRSGLGYYFSAIICFISAFNPLRPSLCNGINNDKLAYIPFLFELKWDRNQNYRSVPVFLYISFRDGVIPHQLLDTLYW